MRGQAIKKLNYLVTRDYIILTYVINPHSRILLQYGGTGQMLAIDAQSRLQVCSSYFGNMNDMAI